MGVDWSSPQRMSVVLQVRNSSCWSPLDTFGYVGGAIHQPDSLLNRYFLLPLLHYEIKNASLIDCFLLGKRLKFKTLAELFLPAEDLLPSWRFFPACLCPATAVFCCCCYYLVVFTAARSHSRPDTSKL